MAYTSAMSFGLFALYNLVSQSLYSNQEQTPSPVSEVSENEPVKNLRTAGNSQIAQRLTERNSVASPETPSAHAAEVESTCYCPPSSVNPNIRETDTGNTALHYAVQNGQIEIAKLLLQMGMDINAPNNQGQSPLHCAASANQPKSIKFLLEKGANVNARDLAGNTALHYAVQNDQIEIAKLLLQTGMDINAPNNQGESPLHFATSANQPKNIKFLLEKGADVNARNLAGKTALQYAVISGQQDTIDLLLWDVINSFTSIRADVDIHAKDFDGHSVLYHAAKNNLTDLVQRLLRKGAKIPTDELPGNLDSKSIVLLYLGAAEAGQLDADLVEFFVDHAKMNPNARNKSGETLLQLAIRKDNMPIAFALLKKGANAEMTYSSKVTLLHEAVKYNNLLVVELLLNQTNVDINAQNQLKKTALHLAAEKAQPRMVEFLVQKGANIHLRDENGYTALHFAAQNGNPTVVLILLSRIADVNAANHLKITPLHLAVGKGDIEIARILLQHEYIQVNAAIDQGGMTALHIAAINGNRPMVELLLNHNANVHARDRAGYTPRGFATRAEIQDLLEQKEKASPSQT